MISGISESRETVKGDEAREATAGLFVGGDMCVAASAVVGDSVLHGILRREELEQVRGELEQVRPLPISLLCKALSTNAQ